MTVHAMSGLKAPEEQLCSSHNRRVQSLPSKNNTLEPINTMYDIMGCCLYLIQKLVAELWLCYIYKQINTTHFFI